MNASLDAFVADWIALWRLAERVAAERGGTPVGAFEPVGLILNSPYEPHRDGGYDTSPSDAIWFASTGGDGVHFSALRAPAAEGVIVMTVPMQFDDPNHVLAESLPEFLALGCATGYFSLERLAYDWGRDEMIESLRAGESDPDDEALLQHVVEAFGFRPWHDVRGRLRHLAATYAEAVRAPSGRNL